MVHFGDTCIGISKTVRDRTMFKWAKFNRFYFQLNAGNPIVVIAFAFEIRALKN